MMIFGPIILIPLISALVNGEAPIYGNLSTGINNTPKLLATTSVAPGLGSYILAALGQTTKTAKPSQSNTTTTPDASSSSYQTFASPTPSVVCLPNTSKCFTDIFYTAPEIASTGSGSAYATKCSNALSSYSSVSSSWGSRHSSAEPNTVYYGGKTWITNTYYSDASTLCDGHARVTYSPAIPTSTTTLTTTISAFSTSVNTISVGWVFPVATPSCSINPTDCDGLWKAYSSSSSKLALGANATSASGSFHPLITALPSPPPCVNSSQSSSNDAFSKTFYGCGPCTIFGDAVQLLYFPEPTTVSRDMCATTPTAKLTHYDQGVGTPYTGSGPATADSSGDAPETMAIGSHTFTSGTAYISIKSVWAEDRCNNNIGTKVSDAILALPSSSLLSLRYSQNHFQQLMTAASQTGYPFNYADLNTPIPYSAWNGQAACYYPGERDSLCDVIYENKFNPQLAMPPGIRKLNPDWEHCEMWYGGLYDPPYALQPGTAVPTPTVHWAKSVSAEPNAAVAPSTPTPTALADHTNNGSEGKTQAAGQSAQVAGQNTGASDQSTQGANENDGGQAGQGSGHNTQTGGQNNQGSGTNDQGSGQDNQGSGQNNQESGQDSQATGGNSENTQAASDSGPSNGAGNGAATVADSGVLVFTAGTSTYTATVINSVIVCGAHTLSAGGSDATLSGGEVISVGSNGLVVSNSPVTVAYLPSAIAVPVASATGAVVTVDGQAQTVTQEGSAGAIDIGTARLSAGGPAVTLNNGEVASAANDGIVVGGTTAKFSTFAAPSANRAIFTADGATLTASGVGNQVTIGSVTLTAGGSVQTLSNGAVVSLGPNGEVLVDGTSAAALSPAEASSELVLTINGTPVTAYEAAGSTDTATIDGTVITRGGPEVTLAAGEVITMGPDGLVVQPGSSTISFALSSTKSHSQSHSQSHSSSKAGPISNTAVLSSQTGAVISQASAPVSTSALPTSAGFAVQVSLRTSIMASLVLISPLLFALYL